MKWPWRKAQNSEPAAAPVALTKNPEEEDEAFFRNLQGLFNNVLWAQEVMRVIGGELDSHYARKHQYLSDCDVMCGPSSVSELIHDMSHSELRTFTTVLTKNWYYCLAALRYWDDQSS